MLSIQVALIIPFHAKQLCHLRPRKCHNHKEIISQAYNFGSSAHPPTQNVTNSMPLIATTTITMSSAFICNDIGDCWYNRSLEQNVSTFFKNLLNRTLR